MGLDITTGCRAQVSVGRAVAISSYAIAAPQGNLPHVIDEAEDNTGGGTVFRFTVRGAGGRPEVVAPEQTTLCCSCI